MQKASTVPRQMKNARSDVECYALAKELLSLPSGRQGWTKVALQLSELSAWEVQQVMDRFNAEASHAKHLATIAQYYLWVKGGDPVEMQGTTHVA
jgi:hypothetical protein